jgi:LysM repeat protein
MFASMKRFAPLLLSLALLQPILSVADEAVDPALIEDLKRLVGRVQDMEESISAQQRRIKDLQEQVETLRSELRQANDNSTRKIADAVSREELGRFAQKLQEVDQKREGDKKTILEEIHNLEGAVTKKLEGLAAAPVPRNNSGSKTGAPKPEKIEKEDTKNLTNAKSGEFYPYKVKKNESLSEILAAYNGVFKAQGKATLTLEQIRKANPKININKIYEGQEILIPVPPDKK